MVDREMWQSGMAAFSQNLLNYNGLEMVNLTQMSQYIYCCGRSPLPQEMGSHHGQQRSQKYVEIAWMQSQNHTGDLSVVSRRAETSSIAVIRIIPAQQLLVSG